ncbi:hypothetical protein N7470_001192 [Penicillium chermesinum]|nr:hypothetical protein N7470_001192 [Penicillium chermesinum]
MGRYQSKGAPEAAAMAQKPPELRESVVQITVIRYHAKRELVIHAAESGRGIRHVLEDQAGKKGSGLGEVPDSFPKLPRAKGFKTYGQTTDGFGRPGREGLQKLVSYGDSNLVRSGKSMAGEEDLDGGSKVWDRVINGHLLSSSGWDLKEGWVDQGQIGAGPDSEPYEPPRRLAGPDPSRSTVRTFTGAIVATDVGRDILASPGV